MKPRVYVETSVISYLTSRPSRDIIVTGHQRSTIDWWEVAVNHFALVSSQLVWEEASLGDSKAASERLDVLKQLPLLKITLEANSLADKLLKNVFPE